MTKSVLIVDDERELCDLISRQIERKGFKTMQAYGAQEALKLYQEHNFSMVISDNQLSGESGVELIKQIKSFSTTDVRCCMITGFCDHNQEQIMAHGIHKIYLKPDDLPQLIKDTCSFLA